VTLARLQQDFRSGAVSVPVRIESSPARSGAISGMVSQLPESQHLSLELES